MEILVISHKYPPSVGGMQRHCYELTTRLKKRATVHTLIQTEGKSKVVFFITAVAKTLKILSQNPNISVIYVNDGLMAFVLARLIRKINIPLVVTIHGLDIVCPITFYQKWLRDHLNKYQAIIAVSDATREECIARGIKPEKIYMIKNGFEPPSDKIEETNRSLNFMQTKLKFQYGLDTKSKKIILSIGRSVKRKGFSWFIENVLPNLPENTCYLMVTSSANINLIRFFQGILPNWLFSKLALFSGLPTDAPKIETLCKSSANVNRVYQINNLSDAEVNALIQLAHVLVMPNMKVEGDFEGFGLVALEAAAQGTICVASAIEGISTALEQGKNGILLPSEDIDRWSNTLDTLLQHNDMEYHEKAKQYQNNTLHNSFSWDKMAQEYYQVFDRVSNLNRYWFLKV